MFQNRLWTVILDCPKLRLWIVIFYFFIFTHLNIRQISVNLDQRLSGLSKITVDSFNFKPSKIMVVEKILDRPKLQLLNVIVDCPKLGLLNVIVDRPKLQFWNIILDRPKLRL